MSDIFRAIEFVITWALKIGHALLMGLKWFVIVAIISAIVGTVWCLIGSLVAGVCTSFAHKLRYVPKQTEQVGYMIAWPAALLAWAVIGAFIAVKNAATIPAKYLYHSGIDSVNKVTEVVTRQPQDSKALVRVADYDYGTPKSLFSDENR